MLIRTRDLISLLRGKACERVHRSKIRNFSKITISDVQFHRVLKSDRNSLQGRYACLGGGAQITKGPENLFLK